MEITTRLKTIKLNEKERGKIADVIDILIDVADEIDDCSTLFGYNNDFWHDMCDGLENAAKTGKFEIESD